MADVETLRAGEVVWTYQRNPDTMFNKLNVPVFANYCNPEVRKRDGHYHRVFVVDGKTFTSKNKARAHLGRESRKKKGKEGRFSPFNLPPIEEKVMPIEIYTVTDSSGIDHDFPTLQQAQEKAGNIVNTFEAHTHEILYDYGELMMSVRTEHPSLTALIENHTYEELKCAEAVLDENMEAWGIGEYLVEYSEELAKTSLNHPGMFGSVSSYYEKLASKSEKKARSIFAERLTEAAARIAETLSPEEEGADSVQVPLEVAANMVDYDQLEEAVKVFLGNLSLKMRTFSV